jgi:polysaccharide biosynthesis/export protein
MKNPKIYLCLLFMGSIIISVLNSCVDSKKLAYFNNIKNDTTVQMLAVPKLFKINKGDVLQISMVSLDVQAMAVFNGGSGFSVSTTATGANATKEAPSGYLVDEKGNITLPLIGIISAEGISKEDLASTITKDLIDKKIVLDPIVTVRILNYKITILGEVTHPGVIPVPNEKITLPEAIGLAGDLTPYGKRDNVLLVRLVGDKLIYKRFSLNNDKMFDKDLYYLQNNDLLYVEGNKARAGASDRSTQTIPIVLSALSVLTILLTLAIRK